MLRCLGLPKELLEHKCSSYEVEASCEAACQARKGLPSRSPNVYFRAEAVNNNF